MGGHNVAGPEAAGDRAQHAGLGARRAPSALCLAQLPAWSRGSFWGQFVPTLTCWA